MENEWIKRLRDRRAKLKAELEALASPVDETGELRGLTAEEDAEFTAKVTEIRSLDTRIDELVDTDIRAITSARTYLTGSDDGTRPALVAVGDGVVIEPNPVYRRNDGQRSFFKDLAANQLARLELSPGSRSIEEIRERLIKSQETRAGDMTTVAGAGGEFAPPLWLIDEFVALARAGRVTADLCSTETLPSGVSSINLPKVASGVTVAVQVTQNSALSDTAMTTTSVTSGITTLGGKQIISMQLLQQSGIPFDRVILQDLALAYAVQLDTQVLYGTNANGQLNGLVNSGNADAFTTATPAPASVTNANSLYYTVQKTAASIQTGRFLPPTAIVMHPRRWAWVLGSVDANARPFVVPAGPQFNGLGNTGEQVSMGFAGSFGSYNVYTDPSVSITANSATNQDEIYVLRADDLYLYESPVQSASFDATYADNASVLFRILGYAAFIPNRYTASVRVIRGTGLVAP